MSRLRALAVPLAAELNPSISGEQLEAALVTAYSVDGQQRALQAGGPPPQLELRFRHNCK